jgi:hypothetical protein
MSLKIGRTATSVAALVAVGAMFVATTPAFAKHRSTSETTFTNWTLTGSLTPKKLNQAVALPKGSVFNGHAEIEYFNYLEEVKGTITGTATVPPFNAQLNLLELIPSTVGITFTQVGPANGVIGEAPLSTCRSGSATCVTLQIPTKVILGMTVVGILGINVPTHCETSEPITFNLATHLPLFALLVYGPHFAGTATIPPIVCDGVEGLVLAPLLTTLMSGPDNPYVLDITRPGVTKPEE